MPSILGDGIARSLGIDLAQVFLGLTLMMLLGAAFSARVGRWLDVRDPAHVLVAGSLLLGGGLFIIGASTHAAVYLFGWLCCGLAVPMGMTLAATTLLAKREGGHGHRDVSLLMFFVGLTPLVAWPVLTWLLAAIGWRGACFAMAAVHAGVCAPMHFLLARKKLPAADAQADDVIGLADSVQGERGKPPLLMLCTFTIAAFVTTGVQVHLHGILGKSGASQAMALTAGTFFAAAQGAARGLEVMLPRSRNLFATATIAAWLPLCALAALGGLGPSSTGAVLFALCAGASAGLSAVVRATLPLGIFGADRYGTVSGVLTAYQTLASAVAPLVVSLLIAHASGAQAFVFACAVVMAGVVLLHLLRRHYATAQPH